MTISKIEQNHLEKLKTKLEGNVSYFKGKNVIYLDYPLHNNIGDHLIYLGAMQLLKKNNNKIVLQFNVINYNKDIVLKYQKKYDAIIVLHGGGNFGDIYSLHQEFRKQVISDFPDIQVVILPQSVHYQKLANCDADLKFFKSENISVHVRDNGSFELLKSYGINVIKTPDCAHALIDVDIFKNHKSTNSNILNFNRRDIEAVEVISDGFDWNDLLTPLDFFSLKIIKKTSSFPKLHLITTYLFKLFSNRLAKKALLFYKKFETINTDRLHGYILAILTGKKVSNSDNSYGKIEKYKTLWMNTLDE
ncbi:MAG: polysaccharide pyruvyl transferase family protein [Paraglaciecola sp.]|nr:polysaccharide pyruvyl transferase family protein [Paraglaciecola sp.]